MASTPKLASERGPLPERPFLRQSRVDRYVRSRKTDRTEKQLLTRLEADTAPNERAELQALLAKIETALKLLDPQMVSLPGAVNEIY